MHDEFEHRLLCKLAYQSWLDRGCPDGSPEQDWDNAKRQLGSHPPESTPTPPIPENLASAQHDAARSHP